MPSDASAFSLSLNDCGSGYSSLACLKHFPFDKLKIAQRFVHGLPMDADAARADGISLRVANCDALGNRDVTAVRAFPQSRDSLFSRDRQATAGCSAFAPAIAPALRNTA
ncbi:MAG: EAL domain-containing protein [Rhodanobacter sp.]|jgi:hypothetical protein|nr:EAL domain-containing protein [Rhodanobacter sp.]